MTRMGSGLLLACAMMLGSIPAIASPWAEVGDNRLRADVELLAAYGVTGDVSTHWPMPWTALAGDIRTYGSLDKQPDFLRSAATRVMGQAAQETAGGINGGFFIDATNTPALVYGFDSLGRGKGQTQISLGFNSGRFSGRLSVGAFSSDFKKRDTRLMLDGSYIAAKIGNALVYAGELSHWWGPGWISALSLSNNASPMPQVGITRLNDSAFQWPVLRWLGPWQAEFFVGLLDGPRVARNTVYDGLRFTFNPAPGLQIGLARTDMMCGTGHPCSPLRDYFNLENSRFVANDTNDQGLIDVKYSRVVGGLPVEAYAQFMNEDSSPLTHSSSSHLAGASIFLPLGRGSPLRFTVEISDSLATLNLFSFGTRTYGVSYTNSTYPDGMRYRGRTLGFSLDNDSQLMSLQGSWSDSGGWFYELSFHHADVGNAHSPGANILTTAPVRINMGEARVTLPFGHFKLDLAGRVQNDQLRPKRGTAAAFEAALRIAF